MDLKKTIKDTGNIKPWLSWLLIIFFFLSVAYFANFRSLNIYDPDSFYHIRHSWLYKELGLSYSEFPWVQYSVIQELKSDLWYGFHIFLLPFTYFDDLGLGIKIAGFTITFAVLLSLYLALRNLHVIYPAIWPFLFIFSSPLILYRMAMTRPHPLSLAFSMLIFSFLIRGRLWPVLVFSFLTAWIHSALFWFPLVVFFVIFIFKTAINQKIEVNKLIALVVGLTGGLFARPNPIANLKLIYIQIVELYISKKEVLEQVMGGELRPPGYKEVETYALPLLLLFSATVILLARTFRKKERISPAARTSILSSLILVSISILMYVNANRALDIMGTYIILFSALVVSYYLSRVRAGQIQVSNKNFNLAVFLTLLFVILIAYNSIAVSGKNFISGAKLRSAFKEPSLWLRDNTKEGEIVFHLNWSQFPMLFFWNQHNYYINGMDPIFLYAYDPSLHWKIFYMLNKDMAGLTCGAINCGPEQIESVHNVLLNDFKASYVFVRRRGNPRFREYLEFDKQHFEKVYDEGSSVIYKVLPQKTKK